MVPAAGPRGPPEEGCTGPGSRPRASPEEGCTGPGSRPRASPEEGCTGPGSRPRASPEEEEMAYRGRTAVTGKLHVEITYEWWSPFFFFSLK